MNNTPSQCKDCKRRTMTCHDGGQYEEYDAFRAEILAQRKTAMAKIAVHDYQRDCVTKALRKRERDSQVRRRPR